MADSFGQPDYQVRFDWGLVGARRAAADVAVIVDVLSFSTSVCVRVERGTAVLPFKWKGTRAAEFARENDAVLAVGRLEATRVGAVAAPYLSPAGLLTCDLYPRIVLPSPNGSTISAALQDAGAEVVIGCLRNASAVAEWLSPHLEQGRSVALVAAGERWSEDDSLRPALEDMLGAGSIVSALANLGFAGPISPESAAGADLFDASRLALADRIANCVGGRELAEKGFAEDIPVASALDVSRTVPRLVDGAFIAAGLETRR